MSDISSRAFSILFWWCNMVSFAVPLSNRFVLYPGIHSGGPVWVFAEMEAFPRVLSWQIIWVLSSIITLTLVSCHRWLSCFRFIRDGEFLGIGKQSRIGLYCYDSSLVHAASGYWSSRLAASVALHNDYYCSESFVIVCNLPSVPAGLAYGNSRGIDWTYAGSIEQLFPHSVVNSGVYSLCEVFTPSYRQCGTGH